MNTTIATAGGQRDSATTARSFRTTQRRSHTDRMTRSQRLELIATVVSTASFPVELTRIG
jgi:hypothetical protein